MAQQTVFAIGCELCYTGVTLAYQRKWVKDFTHVFHVVFDLVKNVLRFIFLPWRGGPLLFGGSRHRLRLSRSFD